MKARLQQIPCIESIVGLLLYKLSLSVEESYYKIQPPLCTESSDAAVKLHSYTKTINKMTTKPQRCEGCSYKSLTIVCLGCYSTSHTDLFSHYQQRMREIADQLLLIPAARNLINQRFRKRISKIEQGRELAIADGDMDDWEIMMESEARVRKIWEFEKDALRKREMDLEEAYAEFMQRCEEEVLALQEKVRS